MSQISYEQHEKEMLEVIDQRDKAEESLSQAYYLITGRSPEWSNLFGHDEALEEIDDAQTALRKTNAALEAQVARLKAPVSDEEVAAVEEELGYPLLEINIYAAVCSAIIASRATQPAPPEGK
jgi:hypothetical protein